MVNQNKNISARALAPSTISVTVLVVGLTLVLSALFVYRSADWSNTPFPPEDKYALMFFAFMMFEMALLVTVLPFLVWYAETHPSQVENQVDIEKAPLNRNQKEKEMLVAPSSIYIWCFGIGLTFVLSAFITVQTIDQSLPRPESMVAAFLTFFICELILLLIAVPILKKYEQTRS